MLSLVEGLLSRINNSEWFWGPKDLPTSAFYPLQSIFPQVKINVLTFTLWSPFSSELNVFKHVQVFFDAQAKGQLWRCFYSISLKYCLNWKHLKYSLTEETISMCWELNTAKVNVYFILFKAWFILKRTHIPGVLVSKLRIQRDFQSKIHSFTQSR